MLPPTVAQVLSPRKYVVLDGVPVADRLAVPIEIDVLDAAVIKPLPLTV
jgi:hypothetical protein